MYEACIVECVGPWLAMEDKSVKVDVPPIFPLSTVNETEHIFRLPLHLLNTKDLHKGFLENCNSFLTESILQRIVDIAGESFEVPTVCCSTCEGKSYAETN